jgi:hypothetical protein
MSSRPRFVILADAPVFVAAVVLLVVVTIAVAWLNGKSEKTARDAATRFAAALVHNDPNAAPPGAREYVSGVREYFGPVTGARLIGTRHKHVNGFNRQTTRSFFVAELLLRAESGPAVIELEFRLAPFQRTGQRRVRACRRPGVLCRGERRRWCAASSAPTAIRRSCSSALGHSRVTYGPAKPREQRILLPSALTPAASRIARSIEARQAVFRHEVGG